MGAGRCLAFGTCWDFRWTLGYFWLAHANWSFQQKMTWLSLFVVWRERLIRSHWCSPRQKWDIVRLLFKQKYHWLAGWGFWRWRRLTLYSALTNGRFHFSLPFCVCRRRCCDLQVLPFAFNASILFSFARLPCFAWSNWSKTKQKIYSQVLAERWSWGHAASGGRSERKPRWLLIWLRKWRNRPRSAYL